MGIPDRNPLHYKDDGHPYLTEFLGGSTQTEIAQKHNTTAKAVEALLRRRRVPEGISITAEEIKKLESKKYN